MTPMQRRQRIRNQYRRAKRYSPFKGNFREFLGTWLSLQSRGDPWLQRICNRSVSQASRIYELFFQMQLANHVSTFPAVHNVKVVHDSIMADVSKYRRT